MRSVLLAMVVSLGGAACAGQHRAAVPPPSQPTSAEARPVSLAGVWDWRHRQIKPDDGDTLLEQEEWHLTQHGPNLGGFYDRSVTWISNDGNPFRCNHDLRYTTYTRYLLSGHVTADGAVQITEVGTSPIPPTACDDGKRELRGYHGARMGADRLVLGWASGQEVLERRPDSLDPAPPSLDAANDADDPREVGEARADSDRGGDPFTGVWHWQLRSSDSDGDIKTEREEWHLARRDNVLTGYYDRDVHVDSADGHRYMCSGAPSYETTARYLLRGEVMSDGEVVIEETGTQTKPGPCDAGRRALDAYRGHLDDGRLLLFWSAGHEALEPGPARH